MLSDILVTLDTSQASGIVLNYVPTFAVASGAERATLLSVASRSDPDGQSTAAGYLAERVEELDQSWDPVLGKPPGIQAAPLASDDDDVAGAVIHYAAGSGASVMMFSTRGW